MLNEIHIRNYRLFSSLDIPHLERVNLIVGKNNSGKSSLLEAIYLLTNDNSSSSLFSILQERGEYIIETEDSFGNVRPNRNYNVASIFNNRNISDITDSLQISEKRHLFLIEKEMRQLSLLDESEEYTHFRVTHSIDDEKNIYEIKISDDGYLSSSERRRPIIFRKSSQFVTTKNTDYRELSKIWDKITLTPNEDRVIKALKIIDPEVERISFTSQQSSSNGILLKLTHMDIPIPLGSMGDGMRRILNIAVSLAVSTHQVLLIDEIDTGLHYSTLVDMWKLVLQTAHDLDVQVFATTHSWDCVEAFQQALSENQANSGQVIRIDRKNDKFKPVIYDRKRLNIAVEQEIEVR